MIDADGGRAVDLTGKLLIAMPGMGDPRFDRSVVFLCAHSGDGAMGLIVNKPAPDLVFADLLDQLGIASGPGEIRLPVHVGGPVEHGRGFVLHSADYGRAGATLGIDGRFGMTATLEILEDIAKGRGPREALLALGYAGWGPGQLENEIQLNGWLTAEARESLVFATPNAEKWAAALGEIGVDARLLSSSAGRA
jgi:putative transcriptional regulator